MDHICTCFALPVQLTLHLTRAMWFQTMWQFDKRRPRRACAAPFKSTKLQTPLGQQPNSHRAPKPSAKAPIRLRVYAGRSETSLVAHTTLLVISCWGSFPCHLYYRGPVTLSSAQSLYSQYPWSLQRSILQKLKNKKKDVIVALMSSPMPWADNDEILHLTYSASPMPATFY